MLIQSPLPGRIGLGKEGICLQGFAEGGVPGELFSVIHRHGEHFLLVLAKGCFNCPLDFLSLAGLDKREAYKF
jgi:hypothetical protein